MAAPPKLLGRMSKGKCGAVTAADSRQWELSVDSRSCESTVGAEGRGAEIRNERRDGDGARGRPAPDNRVMQDFHRLKVWQNAHALAIDVYRLCNEFPRRDSIALATQLRRAALSIPTNIAEGAGKLSNAEFRRFLEIALGSASETLYHLLVARDIGLIEPECYDEFSNRTIEIRRMLTGLIERVRTKHAADVMSSRRPKL